MRYYKVEVLGKAQSWDPSRQSRFCHWLWDLGFRSCQCHWPLTSRWETSMEWQLTDSRCLQNSKFWYLVLIYLYGNSQCSLGRGPRDKHQSFEMRVEMGRVFFLKGILLAGWRGPSSPMPKGVLRPQCVLEDCVLEVFLDVDWGRISSGPRFLK